MTGASGVPQQLTFDAETHTYQLDGRPVPSVTGVLQAVRLIDFASVPNGVADAARLRGTRVHASCHYLAEGDLDWSTVADQDKGYVESAAQYMETLIGRFRACEVRVYHPQYRYAGTFDILLAPQAAAPEWSLIDWKTGQAKDVAAHLQLAAYEGALRAMPSELRTFTCGAPNRMPVVSQPFTGREAMQRITVGLKKDGKFPRVETYDDSQDWPKFLAALTVYNEQRAIRSRKWSE